MTDANSGVASNRSSLDDRGAHALVIDVDGTLVRTDLLWEGLIRIAAERPGLLLGAARALLRGRASLKTFVAQHAPADVATVPMAGPVLSLIEEARAQGRPVYLVSGAAHANVLALGKHLAVDGAYGSDGANLTGETKLRFVRTLCGTFDYAGNSTADLPLWRAARRAYVANPRIRLVRGVRHVCAEVVPVGEPRRPARALVRAIRPHQCIKNTLLLLPMLAGHLAWTLHLAGVALTAMAAFSAGASSIYLLNDLLDLPHDRRHAKKRLRPLAAGDLGIGTAITASIVLVLVAIGLASRLPASFGLTLGTYLVLSLTYASAGKRILGVDVIALAVLYTLRVIAGAAAADIALTRWFLAFSIFLFLSLAVAKRVVELRRSAKQGILSLSGRSYVTDDVPTLSSLGVGAAIASSLVYCLYINGPEALKTYARPDLLWIGLPILLCWFLHFWMKVGRVEVDDDPVIFAMRDRTSLVLALVFLLSAGAASLAR